MSNSKIFKIHKFWDTHTCPVKGRLISKRQLKTSVLGAVLLDKYSDPKINYTLTVIRKDMKREHGITLSYVQAWRGRQKAFSVLRKDQAMSYGKIPIYLYILKKHI